MSSRRRWRVKVYGEKGASSSMVGAVAVAALSSRVRVGAGIADGPAAGP